MSAAGVLFAILPVLFFYFIYRDYFVFRHDWVLQTDALFRGILAASLLLIIFGAATLIPLSWHIPAFLEAALPEKSAVFISIILLAPRVRSLSEACATGSVTGLGFALVENLVYLSVHPAAVISARLLTAVPLHMSTCGLMGFYVWQMRQRHGLERYAAFICALPLTTAAHAFFDYYLVSGRPFGAGLAVLFPLLVMLDLHLAYARSIPSPGILQSMGIDLAQWLILKRQAAYERWILRSIASDRAEYPPIFRFQINAKRILLGIIFISLPLAHGMVLPELFSDMERRAFFITFPGLLFATLLISGLFNPAYFRSGMLRIPMTMQVWLEGGGDPAACYDVSQTGTFLKTALPLKIGETLRLSFSRGRIVSPVVEARVVWDNHRNLRQEFGSVVVFRETTRDFRRFVRRIRLIEIREGLRSILRFPGRNVVRRLFVQPETMMQDIRYFPAGTILIHEGETGDEFFMVRQGKVRVTKKIGEADQELAELGPGEILGEMAIAGRIPRSATAVCRTDVILAVADGKDLDALVRNNPEFARALLYLTARRSFESNAAQEAAIEGARVDAELARALTHSWIRILVGAPPSPRGEIAVTLSPSHLEAAGVTEEEAVRILRTNPRNVHAADGRILERIWSLSRFRLRVGFKKPPPA